MWSMQSYQYQAEEIRQQYNNMIAAKDYEVGTNSLCENTYSLKGRNLFEGFKKKLWQSARRASFWCLVMLPESHLARSYVAPKPELSHPKC